MSGAGKIIFCGRLPRRRGARRPAGARTASFPAVRADAARVQPAVRTARARGVMRRTAESACRFRRARESGTDPSTTGAPFRFPESDTHFSELYHNFSVKKSTAHLLMTLCFSLFILLFQSGIHLSAARVQSPE